MNDKEKIYLQACLYAINKLTEKGSCRYSYKNNDGEWNSIAWNEITDWVLEKRGAKSETATFDEIKSEIEKKYTKAKQMNSVLQMNAYTDCLQIIDKYRAGERK